MLLQVSLRIHRQRNHCDFSDVNFLSNICNTIGSKLKFLFTTNTQLTNVHTWAISFLRHLTNTSCMVTFFASTDSGPVPIWGPVRSQAVQRRLFIVLMTAAHISPTSFPSESSSATHKDYFLQYTIISFIFIIHRIYTHAYIFILDVLSMSSFLLIFMVGRLPSDSCVRYNNIKATCDWGAQEASRRDYPNY